MTGNQRWSFSSLYFACLSSLTIIEMRILLFCIYQLNYQHKFSKKLHLWKGNLSIWYLFVSHSLWQQDFKDLKIEI